MGVGREGVELGGRAEWGELERVNSGGFVTLVFLLFLTFSSLGVGSGLGRKLKAMGGDGMSRRVLSARRGMVGEGFKEQYGVFSLLSLWGNYSVSCFGSRACFLACLLGMLEWGVQLSQLLHIGRSSAPCIQCRIRSTRDDRTESWIFGISVRVHQEQMSSERQ
ncbi:hypothetical protein BJ875DRAFT_1356 [Amylocarpus encephaloides]|uniref:Uncharacterized protein n=1 Tax=Amylocarpus encephaloides TaxID=45428 RepID=A0A9P8CAP1_9HELO|nr:hypothetical protein BJ875DRAFT_1356 [Amylocarpus encephaloides]